MPASRNAIKGHWPGEFGNGLERIVTLVEGITAGGLALGHRVGVDGAGSFGVGDLNGCAVGEEEDEDIDGGVH